MPTTTDFQGWLDNLDDTHIEEIYNLYESVIGVTQMGEYLFPERKWTSLHQD
jgi:hypothetical protein